MTVTADQPADISPADPTNEDEHICGDNCADHPPATQEERAAHQGAVTFLSGLPFKPVTREQVRGALDDLPPLEQMDTRYYALAHRDLEAALLPAPLHGTGLLDSLTEGYQFGQYVGAPDHGPLGIVLQLARCGDGLRDRPDLDTLLTNGTSTDGVSYVPASLLHSIGVTPRALNWEETMRLDTNPTSRTR